MISILSKTIYKKSHLFITHNKYPKGHDSLIMDMILWDFAFQNSNTNITITCFTIFFETL